MAKKNKNKQGNSYSGPPPEDDTRTGETDYNMPFNNALETLKLLRSIDFLNLNEHNKNNLPPASFDATLDNTRTGEFNDALGFSTAIPNAPPPVNNPLQAPGNITQSSGGVIPTAPQIPLVPTSPNGMTDLLNTAQTAQAQQLGVDPAGMAFINQQKAANLPQTEIGAQGMASLFPGMKHNINVGTYGGSIVGNNPIFVPGGNIMAIDPVLEKRKLEEAAKIKAAQDAAKNADFTLRKPKQLQDKFFQESVDKQANALNNEFISLARDIYGEDAQQVINNPQMFDIGREYIQTFDALDLMVEQADQITAVLADMQSNIDKGDKFYSPETLKKLEEYQNMMKEYESGNVKALIGLRPLLNDLQGGKVLDEYFKDKNIIKSIEGVISGDTKFSNLNQDFDKLTTSEATSYNENIRILSEQLARDAFSSEISKGLYTVEDIATRLKGYLQNEYKSKTTLARTTVGDGSSGGSTKITDLDNLIGEPNVKTFTNPDGSPYEYNTTSEFKLKTKKDGTVRMSGLVQVLPDGQRVTIPDINDMTIVSFNGIETQPRTIKAIGDKSNLLTDSWYGEKETALKAETLPTFVGQYKTIEDGVEVIKQGVFLLDDTAIDSIETDSDKLGIEKGLAKQAAKKVVAQTEKNSNLAPSNETTTEEVDYSNL